MKIHYPDPAQLHAGLSAMRTIMDAKGGASPAQEEVLEVFQRFFGTQHAPATQHDIRRLRSITPEALSQAIQPETLRAQIINGMILICLIDGKAHPAETAQINEYAAAFGIRPRSLTDLKKLEGGRMKLLRLDLMRRSWMVAKIREGVLPREGILGAFRSLRGLRGKYKNREVERRFRNLKSYPDGTLGRAYWEFCTNNQLAFPGEKTSLPEVMACHDCAHILGGYGTSMEEELLILGFTAGFMNEDPGRSLMFGLLQWQMGVPIAAVAAGQTDLFDVEKFLRAADRGSAMAQNLNDPDWDMWGAFKEQVLDLRVRYNVLPRRDH